MTCESFLLTELYGSAKTRSISPIWVNPQKILATQKIHIHNTATHISNSKLPESYSVPMELTRKKRPLTLEHESLQPTKQKKEDEQEGQILTSKMPPPPISRSSRRRRRRSPAAGSPVSQPPPKRSEQTKDRAS